MDNRVLGGIVAVIIVVVVVAAAMVVYGGDDNEEGGVTTGVNYHGNGGTYEGGTTYGFTETTVQTNLFTYDGYVFMGWNTAADGSGTSYAVGDAIIYGNGTVDLYAQWAYGLNISVSSMGHIDLMEHVHLYLVDENGDETELSAFHGSYVLPDYGAAGIAVGIDGVSSWAVIDGVFVGTDSEGNAYNVSIEMTGADPNELMGTALAAWLFQYDNPVSCTISISEQQAN